MERLQAAEQVGGSALRIETSCPGTWLFLAFLALLSQVLIDLCTPCTMPRSLRMSHWSVIICLHICLSWNVSSINIGRTLKSELDKCCFLSFLMCLQSRVSYHPVTIPVTEEGLWFRAAKSFAQCYCDVSGEAEIQTQICPTLKPTSFHPHLPPPGAELCNVLRS